MRIEIDQASGFCNGVVSPKHKVTITHEELASLHGVKVLLRAHGEPPSTYVTARSQQIDIIDATCPVVLHLQRRIKESYDSLGPGEQIVIYGKRGHAEVNGLVGQTNGEAIVVEDIDGLSQIDFDRDIILYSQTTKSIDGLKRMVAEIESRKSPTARFRYNDTICRQVANRVPRLRTFAAAHQVVFFVSGKKSSNGKFLYAECGVATLGICGATSTPRWLMEQVKEYVSSMTLK